jgi:hypothetical protein
MADICNLATEQHRSQSQPEQVVEKNTWKVWRSSLVQSVGPE